jgi:hypothetical protein
LEQIGLNLTGPKIPADGISFDRKPVAEFQSSRVTLRPFRAHFKGRQKNSVHHATELTQEVNARSVELLISPMAKAT